MTKGRNRISIGLAVAILSVLVAIGVTTSVSAYTGRMQLQGVRESWALAEAYDRARADLDMMDGRGNHFMLTQSHEDFVQFGLAMNDAFDQLHTIEAKGNAADREFASQTASSIAPLGRNVLAIFGAIESGTPYSGQIPDYSLVAQLRASFAEAADAKSAAATGVLSQYSTAQSRRANITLGFDVLGLAVVLVLGLALRKMSIAGARAIARQRQRSDARFRSLVQNLTDVIVVANIDRLITYVSPSVTTWFGYAVDDLQGVEVLELVHPEDLPSALDGLRVATSAPQEQGRLLRIKHADGSWRHCILFGTNLLEDPDVEGFVFNVRDVTAERAARASQERLTAVIGATSDVVVLADSSQTVIHLNSAAKRVLEGFVRGGDARGLALQDIIPPGLRSRVAEEIIPHAEKYGSWSGELTFSLPGGSETIAEVELLAHHDSHGSLEFWSWVLRDITERKRFESQLIYLANHDSLTGLFNRRRFAEEVERELGRSRRTGAAAALIILDIDNFKAVNDSLGHKVGDEVLCGLASEIRRAVPEDCMVARLGGDEFAVLLRHANQDDAARVAEGLRAAARALTVETSDQTVSTTVSIGLAMIPGDAADAEVLLMNADIAMYEAKGDGDSWRTYSPASGARAGFVSRRLWEQRIRAAIDEDLFTLHFQPICLPDRSVVAHEVLVRMTAADGTLIMPTEFLLVAEQSGLIQAVDRWVVAHAIELMAARHEAGEEVTFAVNLSGRSLADSGLPAFIAGQVLQFGIDPTRLILEITETAAIADMEEARLFIAPLAELGIRFALDDFGVGFASFAYLKHLPIDHVKIDGSFIRNLPNDLENQSFVRALVDVSHGLGKEVVAEFVENDETLRLLGRLGVDYVQGYHLGRPAPLASLQEQTDRRLAA